VSEPDPVLSDPARERLAHKNQVQDEWGPHLAEMMRDPEFRAMYEAASRAEFSRSTRVLVYTAAVLGLVLAFGVFWYVFTEIR
jgi:hypothetical protein